MNIFLLEVDENELPAVLRKLHGVAREPVHTLVDDPATADLILVCGACALQPQLVTSNPLVRRFPDKCAAYTDEDLFFASAARCVHVAPPCYSVRRGRVRCYSYIAQHVEKGNPFTGPAREAKQKDLLFSFQGASSSLVRKRLFRVDFGRDDVLIENTSSHWNWAPGESTQKRQRSYAETILRSHFVLCPRGAGTGSFRLFEVMKSGVAPVLISDQYVLPEGPDWDSFLIRVNESDVSNLPKILEARVRESAERGQRAREAWQQWFSADKEFNRIVELSAYAMKSAGGSEKSLSAVRAVSGAEAEDVREAQEHCTVTRPCGAPAVQKASPVPAPRSGHNAV